MAERAAGGGCQEFPPHCSLTIRCLVSHEWRREASSGLIDSASLRLGGPGWAAYIHLKEERMTRELIGKSFLL